MFDGQTATSYDFIKGIEICMRQVLNIKCEYEAVPLRRRVAGGAGAAAALGGARRRRAVGGAAGGALPHARAAARPARARLARQVRSRRPSASHPLSTSLH